MLEPFGTKHPLKAKRMLGTGFGLSEADRDFIKFQLSRNLHHDLRRDDLPIRIDNGLKCAPFFDNYWRSLAFV